MAKSVIIDGREFNVGDEVYFVPDDKRNEPLICKIEKIGNKWIELEYVYDKINIQTLRTKKQFECSGCSGKIYASEEHFVGCANLANERKELVGFIETKINSLSVEKLKAIRDIITNK